MTYLIAQRDDNDVLRQYRDVLIWHRRMHTRPEHSGKPAYPALILMARATGFTATVGIDLTHHHLHRLRGRRQVGYHPRRSTHCRTPLPRPGPTTPATGNGRGM